ncbi:YwdI family protein [Solibacillus sp. CAU 1738]|uniref:YwdI family protein n=1 Tax=Solibacillus sp. CAU 1738 TaxID=3140363 RepID=UPI0032618C9E
MISYEVLLSQIEKHVMSAKSAANDQIMREQLTAVRALCDVVLNSEQHLGTSKPVYSNVQQLQVQQAPLQENDANGDSIFDF